MRRTPAAALVFPAALLALLSGGCANEVAGPAPEVAAPAAGADLPVDPGIVCRDQLTTDVTVHGKGLSPIPVDVPNDPHAALPTVTLVRKSDLAGGAAGAFSAVWDGEPGGENAAKLSWQSEEAMTFTVDQDLALDGGASVLEPGLYDVEVTNPNTNATTTPGALAVAPKPTLQGVSPGLVCLAQGPQTVTLTGTTFLRVGDRLPTLEAEGRSFGSPTLDGCTPVAAEGFDAASCTSATFTLEEDGLSSGAHDVVLTNPETAACHTEETIGVVVVPAPTIDAVEPSLLCVSQGDVQLTIQGQGFLEVDGVPPTVTLNGAPVSLDGIEGCSALSVPGETVRTCDALTLTVASGSLATGPVAVGVRNPGDAACGAEATGVFGIGGVPTLASVEPSALCTTTGGSMVLNGTGFAPGAIVRLTQGDATVVADATVNPDGTRIAAEVPAGLAPGTYDVTVSNGAGCDASLAAALKIDPEPFVFFVDPPVAYNGISIQATIYTSGLTAAASSVELLGPSNEIESLVGTPVNGEPNRILVTLPSGLAPGSWDVSVTSEGGCTDVLHQGLNVTDTTTLALDRVDPSYLSRTQDTAVGLYATAGTLPPGQVDFEATPRAYLSPTNATAGSIASKIDAVDFVNAKTLTGVVADGLDAGVYDLIVVNPDATVGVLPGAVTVTTDEPPTITSVVPGSLDANTAGLPVKVLGENFGTYDTADPANPVFVPPLDVSLSCRAPGGTMYTGSTSDATVAILTADETSIDLSISTNALAAPNGSVCVVQVTNPDRATNDYSAISIKNPSANLYDWNENGAVTRPAMVEARRALGLVAGRPTGTSRFLYAVGGDAGSPASAKTSVEAANVGVYGDLGAWALQRSALPSPRTKAGTVRIGRFVYVVGGTDGTAAQASVLRAQILDPLATPEVKDLSLAIGDGGATFGAGFWYYRISAVFPDTDPSNPGGESLPGEPLVVQLPDQHGIELTLAWDAIPGASGYRIYRTPLPNLSSGDVELVEEVTGGTTTFTDTGLATNAAARPLPTGSLGVWHDVGVSLSTPREGLAAAAAADPSLPGRWYLYAFGGRDASGTWLSSYDYLSIDVTAPAAGTKETESQLVVANGLGTATLNEPRADLGTWRVTHADELVIPDASTWLYVGPGTTTGGGDVTTVEAALVPAGGDIGAFTEVTGKGGRTGAGYLDGNGFLFLFGGGNGGSPSPSGVSAEICQVNGQPSGCLGGPPELRNWTSEGTSMSENRTFMGTAQESAFFFVAGGCTADCDTATPIVTSSVDQTVK